MADLLVAMIIMGVMMMMCMTILANVVGAKRTEMIQANLPSIGESVETFFVKNPHISTIDAQQLPTLPEDMKQYAVAVAGNASDHCVITSSINGDKEDLQKDLSSPSREGGLTYFVYQSKDSTVSEMEGLSSLTCIASGGSIL